MKALTVYQPYATLLALGLKEFESRSWGTRYRGPIAIHAAKRWTNEEWFARDLLNYRLKELGSMTRLPDQLPTGCVVGLAMLVDCAEVTPELAPKFRPFERAAGDLEVGRFAWQMDEAAPLREAIVWRGSQGLWDVTLPLLLAINTVLPLAKEFR